MIQLPSSRLHKAQSCNEDGKKGSETHLQEAGQQNTFPLTLSFPSAKEETKD